MSKNAYSFPFEPYEIQLRLMKEIEECIEMGKIGIFESPTGTGKSLSVLCSTMTWLENAEIRRKREMDEIVEKSRRTIEEAENDDDWVAGHRRKMEARRELDDVENKQEIQKRIDERIENSKKGLIEIKSRKRKNVEDDLGIDLKLEEEEKDEFAPDDYQSDGECSKSLEDDENAENFEKSIKCVKIFYASRTHSQLDQLIEELAKTRFKPRVVTCASRGTLCVNEEVTKLKLNHLINEKCMELRKNQKKESSEKKAKDEKGGEVLKKRTTGKKCSSSCEYYNSQQIEEVVNGILAEKLRNTMEVTKQGKASTGCPYFATRKSIPLCQLVLLPYQVLLHNGTREAWGVDLEGNVVVLDEAHNVLNTIGSLYSAEISTKSLTVALKLIREYIETYKLRLKAKNLLYMRQLQILTNSMLGYLKSENNRDEVLSVPVLIGRLNVVEINLFKLAAYIEKSDLCKKFHGFYMRMQKMEMKKENEKPKLTGIAKLMAKKEEEAKEEEEKVPVRTLPSPLFSLKSFIDALTNKCEDGRVVIEKLADNEAKFRYMLLNPADRLAEVVNAARSTILVGGTMEPAQLLVETLSRGIKDSSQIQRFSCSHVIDDDQLLSMVVEKTVDGKPFQLTYQTRTNETVLKSLALSLQALLNHLPNGVVIFVPSYDFLFNFQQKLKSFGIWKRIEEKKRIFTESRSPTSNVWEMYSRAAKTPNGAVFFAVVGGKMSEGINFCDELGRAVIVIGLPYPNKTSVELRERMKFLDSQISNGGQLLYESLCMHAVNQAIGRAIRHRRDYAAVYLFDERFSKPATKSKLSAWIGGKTESGLGFGEIIRRTKAFFEAKKL